MQKRFCRQLVVAVSIIATLACATSSFAQRTGKWSVRAEAGGALIHEVEGGGGPLWGVTANRQLGGSGITFWEISVLYGDAIDRFLMVNPGVQLRLRPGRAVTPVLAANAGLLSEAEWFGFAPNATVGLLGTFGTLSVGAMGSFGTHDGALGPHLLRIGIGMNSRK